MERITFIAFIKGYKTINGSKHLIFNAGDKLDKDGYPVEKTLPFGEGFEVYVKPLIGKPSHLVAESDEKGVWSVKRVLDSTDIATINFITSQQNK